jgi:hypothetical protein
MKKLLATFTSIIFLLGFFFEFALAQLQMPVMDTVNIEQLVRTQFADAPLMIEIAKCESGYRQYRNDGSILRGGTGGRYIGVFQISEGHTQRAKDLGYDILTAEGNIGFARFMYNEQGTSPWASCLKVPAPATLTSSPSTTNSPITSNLQFGMVSAQVLTLQQILNVSGFPVANSGPGSPGQETTRFGQLTKEAVQKFQCAQGIACSGSESTTGFGRVGPKTRAALMRFVQ